MLFMPHGIAQGDAVPCMSAGYTLDHFAKKFGEKSVSHLKSGPGEFILTVNRKTQTWTMFYVKGSFLCPLFVGQGIKGPLLTEFTPI